MWEFYKHGGITMFPTTLFGFILVALALSFVIRPHRHQLTRILAFGATTLVCGLLGCSVGLIMTFRFIRQLEPSEQFSVAAMGVAESLNNVVLALLIVLIASVVTCVGSLRLKSKT